LDICPANKKTANKWQMSFCKILVLKKYKHP
jgi:hypothetical protein